MEPTRICVFTPDPAEHESADDPERWTREPRAHPHRDEVFTELGGTLAAFVDTLTWVAAQPALRPVQVVATTHLRGEEVTEPYLLSAVIRTDDV